VWAVELGVAIFQTDLNAGIVDVARTVEQAGLESLFVVEHTHVPVSRRDVLTLEWHSQTARILDPFTALGAAAAVTSRLKLGTGICIVAQHDPIILAKQVATIDHLSDGRFLFGVGAGWLVEEMHNHGVEARLRWLLMREKLLAMKAIWADEEAEFHGRFVDFDPIYLWPKPVQDPSPPILIGGNAPRSLRIVAELGDGWLPVVVDVTEFEEQLSQLRRVCEQAGTGPGIEVTAVVVPRDDADLGTWEPDQKLLERCAELGVTRCATWAPTRDLAAFQAFLERYLQISDPVR
jgi:probable F420-dependent oxidoreductase